VVLSRPTLYTACPARELLALDDDSLSRRWLDLQNERIDAFNNTIVQQLVLGTMPHVRLQNHDACGGCIARLCRFRAGCL